jgi:hypothetical protein
MTGVVGFRSAGLTLCVSCATYGLMAGLDLAIIDASHVSLTCPGFQERSLTWRAVIFYYYVRSLSLFVLCPQLKQITEMIEFV